MPHFAAATFDPGKVFVFFDFGDAFDDIVGRLHLVTQIMMETSAKESKHPRDIMELERRRVIRLALKPKERIQTYVNCNFEKTKGARKYEGKE